MDGFAPDPHPRERATDEFRTNLAIVSLRDLSSSSFKASSTTDSAMSTSCSLLSSSSLVRYGDFRMKLRRRREVTFRSMDASDTLPLQRQIAVRHSSISRG